VAIDSWALAAIAIDNLGLIQLRALPAKGPVPLVVWSCERPFPSADAPHGEQALHGLRGRHESVR